MTLQGTYNNWMTQYMENKTMVLPIGKGVEEEREGTYQTFSLWLVEPSRNSLTALWFHIMISSVQITGLVNMPDLLRGFESC